MLVIYSFIIYYYTYIRSPTIGKAKLFALLNLLTRLLPPIQQATTNGTMVQAFIPFVFRFVFNSGLYAGLDSSQSLYSTFLSDVLVQRTSVFVYWLPEHWLPCYNLRACLGWHTNFLSLRLPTSQLLKPLAFDLI